jgi:hypothetical protein
MMDWLPVSLTPLRRVLIPTNIHHHASRTGTFVMLVLGKWMNRDKHSVIWCDGVFCVMSSGEAVIALLTPTLLSSTRIYTFTLLGSLLIFMLAVMVSLLLFSRVSLLLSLLFP